MTPKLIICMGVSGSGKTTLAKYIAEQTGAKYLEADDYHPPANIALMSAGTPLTDAEREPWIEALCGAIEPVTSNVIMAYSGLKYEHRLRFQNLNKACLFLNLKISAAEVERRFGLREDHFMPVSLIKSQFASMQPIQPHEPVKDVDSARPIEQVKMSAMQYVEDFMGLGES